MLEEALSLVIPTRLTREYNDQDFTNLFESYRLAEVAKDSFLGGEVTLDEYMQLLECHEINIDSYLETIEHNLTAFRYL
jgi:hypothetical protein